MPLLFPPLRFSVENGLSPLLLLLMYRLSPTPPTASCLWTISYRLHCDVCTNARLLPPLRRLYQSSSPTAMHPPHQSQPSAASQIQRYLYFLFPHHTPNLLDTAWTNSTFSTFSRCSWRSSPVFFPTSGYVHVPCIWDAAFSSSSIAFLPVMFLNLARLLAFQTK